MRVLKKGKGNVVNGPGLALIKRPGAVSGDVRVANDVIQYSANGRDGAICACNVV